MTRWWIYLEIATIPSTVCAHEFYNVPQLFCVNTSFYRLKMYKCLLLMMVCCWCTCAMRCVGNDGDDDDAPYDDGGGGEQLSSRIFMSAEPFMKDMRTMRML